MKAYKPLEDELKALEISSDRGIEHTGYNATLNERFFQLRAWEAAIEKRVFNFIIGSEFKGWIPSKKKNAPLFGTIKNRKSLGGTGCIAFIFHEQDVIAYQGFDDRYKALEWLFSKGFNSLPAIKRLPSEPKKGMDHILSLRLGAKPDDIFKRTTFF